VRVSLLQLDIGVLLMTKVKKDNEKVKTDIESGKCPCGCGQDLEPRETPYWIIDGTDDSKQEVFGEGCREDENRIANAQRALHARMTENQRDDALKWAAYYRALLREDQDSC